MPHDAPKMFQDAPRHPKMLRDTSKCPKAGASEASDVCSDSNSQCSRTRLYKRSSVIRTPFSYAKTVFFWNLPKARGKIGEIRKTTKKLFSLPPKTFLSRPQDAPKMHQGPPKSRSSRSEGPQDALRYPKTRASESDKVALLAYPSRFCTT